MATTTAGRTQVTAITSVSDVRGRVAGARREGLAVGLVPTMGALHEGHLSLIRAARNECELVVVSIFVNPTQFGPHEDFSRYPRDLPADLALCGDAGADLVFHPATEVVYPPGFTSHVEVEGVSNVLEGEFRPSHFRGVATVVLKLFQMVPADVAYFGQKDYQQQTIIRRMCEDLNVPIRIRVCPTVREPDGLALSSRNVYLSADEHRAALSLSQSLELARRMLHKGETNLELVRRKMWEHLTRSPLVRPDYATLVDPDTLEEVAKPLPRLVAVVAARVGSTRLIDNEIITRES